MTAAEILLSSRTRLDAPGTWREADDSCVAFDAHGEGVGVTSPAAVQWDLYGALVAAGGGDRALNTACALFCRAVGIDCDTTAATPDPSAEQMTAMYDWLGAPGRTHVEVLAAIDRASELAEGSAAT